MDGFFGGAALRPVVDLNDESVDKFAQAIAGRFNNADRPLLTARLTPAASITPALKRPSFDLSLKSDVVAASTPSAPLPRMPINSTASRSGPSSSAPVTAPPATANDFTAATASTLPDIIRTPRVLILDIRPHTAYSAARLPHAISLSVPSTLLKRPAFTLQKLSTMLSSQTARARFSGWSKASRIIIYDADSVALNEGSNLLGLLRKFHAEGFKGDIAWLQGGIQSLWRDQRHLVDEGPVSDDEDESEAPRFLRAKDLPMAAFQQSTTTSVRNRAQRSVSPSPVGSGTETSGLPLSSYTGLQTQSRLAAANPFYDNIRQNLELSQGITERIPLRLSPTTAERARELPFAWLRDIAASAGQDEGTEALAMQFYRIELGEQRRMQGVMSHHSMQNTAVEESKKGDQSGEGKSGKLSPFPYSILAGIEKGAKNRYRNIWPFEHARVHLQGYESDDYINASFVQPLGTKRRYIATQGPLPSTFADFWSIVWEQDVRVIVMLTRLFEAGSIKCGKYWTDGQYGPLRLRCISRSGMKEEEDPNASGRGGDLQGGFFGASLMGASANDKRDDSNSDEQHNDTIRRTFELTHIGFPGRKRTVTQLQYLGWPDMNVPNSPKGLLRFMYEVDELVDKANLAPDSEGRRRTSPALLHCSAGVGRTGAFIVIDAIIDGVRQEMRKRAEAKKTAAATEDGQNEVSSGTESDDRSGSPEAMDVDSSIGYRDGSLAPSVPDSFTTHASPNASHRSNTSPPASYFSHHSPRVTHTQAGPVATLHVGGEKSSRTDIHVPVVPSSTPAQMKTPRPHQSTDLPPVTTSTLRPTVAPVRPRPTSMSSTGSQRPIMRKVLASEFTEADADSMFTSPSPNPAFAMDVESLQPSFGQLVSSSSSGEGNGSGGDMGSAGSGGSSGSSSRAIKPIQLALARMSSSDDVPGPTERSDSDSLFSARLSPRARAGSRSGSGSGSGEGSGMTSGASNSGSASGGYSSASSLGLRAFSGLGMSPTNTSGNSSSASGGMLGPTGTRLQQQRPMRLSMQKPSLLAPKPTHPLQTAVPLSEGPTQSSYGATILNSKLKAEKHVSLSSVHSILSSSSSKPSSADIYSTSYSTPADSSETPLSTHGMSRSPSPSKAKGSPPEMSTFSDTAFDYLGPRKLHMDDSPPPLSSLEEPIRQILEDMREQRMSLCQSLRQYVFVHNAILEGVLQVVDEERKRVGLDAADLFEDTELGLDQSATMPNPASKRGASPTELPKQDKKGDVALVKRPSIKRGKSISSGSSSASA